MRKVGVEEELMLVDPDSGRVTAVSAKALRAREDAAERGEVDEDDAPVEQELFLQQIETATPPCLSAEDLRREMVRGRQAVGEAARAAGAVAVAAPTPVLPIDEPTITPKPRYRRILEEYGETTRQSLVCGMHMHVDVDGDEEAVRVMDGIRPWLPVLLAVSSNSPFWEGRDTRFASWRSQVWNRWPSSGPAEPFRSVDNYRSTVSRMIEWGVAVDEAMVYLDARIARSYPTVEVRVADICTDVDDAVLVAALARALVTTVAESSPVGEPWRSDLLRAASWRAARHGLSSTLVNPLTLGLAPAREVLEALRGHTKEALVEGGDWEWTGDALERLLAQGTGAARQRKAFEVSGSVEGVVQDLVRRTEASWAGSHESAC